MDPVTSATVGVTTMPSSNVRTVAGLDYLHRWPGCCMLRTASGSAPVVTRTVTSLVRDPSLRVAPPRSVM